MFSNNNNNNPVTTWNTMECYSAIYITTILKENVNKQLK